MKSRKTTRLLLFLLSLAAIQYPNEAYADAVKLKKDIPVYFDHDCLVLHSSHRAPSNIADNEMKIEETSGTISFDKRIVTETRDGIVVGTYIQIHNCRALEPTPPTP